MSESTEPERVYGIGDGTCVGFLMRGNHGSRSQEAAGCQLAMAESLAFDRIAFA